MSDILTLGYPWIKAFHIMAVISWMAGLFYLPRLFVYHAEKVGNSGGTHNLFLTMEYKLLRVIMNPAMVATWIFGLCLVVTPGIVDWAALWPWTKLIGVIGMTVFHMWLSKQRKIFMESKNILSGRTFRLMNEIPTVLMILIVLSVVVKF